VKGRPGAAFTTILVVGVLALAGAAGHWQFKRTNARGRLELTTIPADATVTLDEKVVGDHSPLSIGAKAGPHWLSVKHAGYAHDARRVDIQAGRALTLEVALSASPRTGMEITSDPPGAVIWLDGRPMKGPAGGSACTDFVARRIAPGPHQVELKGQDGSVFARRNVDVEAGVITRVAVTLDAPSRAVLARWRPCINPSP
jgi:PEGA domain